MKDKYDHVTLDLFLDAGTNSPKLTCTPTVKSGRVKKLDALSDVERVQRHLNLWRRLAEREERRERNQWKSPHAEEDPLG